MHIGCFSKGLHPRQRHIDRTWRQHDATPLSLLLAFLTLHLLPDGPWSAPNLENLWPYIFLQSRAGFITTGRLQHPRHPRSHFCCRQPVREAVYQKPSPSKGKPRAHAYFWILRANGQAILGHILGTCAELHHTRPLIESAPFPPMDKNQINTRNGKHNLSSHDFAMQNTNCFFAIPRCASEACFKTIGAASGGTY